MNLDPSEWYFFELVNDSGTIVDSGYETPRGAVDAAMKTGTRARVSGTWQYLPMSEVQP
jgi:hypothetical protein